MNWFSICFQFFQFVSEGSTSVILKRIALLFSFPGFKSSHLFFEFAYALDQRSLRLLSSEDFFLKFYDRRIATHSVVNFFKPFRQIECGLQGTEASECFAYHVFLQVMNGLCFSWTLDFVIDDFSRFRKRLGRGCAWVRNGQLQVVLIVYGHDETGLARQIEPMKIINFGLEDHGSDG
jgi:hypothetical protein